MPEENSVRQESKVSQESSQIGKKSFEYLIMLNGWDTFWFNLNAKIGLRLQ